MQLTNKTGFIHFVDDEVIGKLVNRKTIKRTLLAITFEGMM